MMYDRPDDIEIIRVWGRADNYELELKKSKDGSWNCYIPADMEDGTYAVELWAVDSAGKEAYWTGELFMSNGICHVSIYEPNYTILVDDKDRATIQIDERTTFSFIVTKCVMNSSIWLITDMTRLEISKGCPHSKEG